MPACKFTKKNSFTLSLSCILPSFSQNASRLLHPKSLRVQFFQRKVVLLAIYLFNHDSFKSTIFMLNTSFDVLLSAVFVKLESFVSCNIKLLALWFDIYFFLLKLNYSPSWWYNFYFDICIKFTLSTIISTRKEWLDVC